MHISICRVLRFGGCWTLISVHRRRDVSRRLAYDATNQHLWIADRASSCIRRLDRQTGHLSTVAGVCGKSGPPPTHFAAPVGLALDMAQPDGSGELLVADTGNNVIRALSLNATGDAPVAHVVVGSIGVAPHAVRDGPALYVLITSSFVLPLFLFLLVSSRAFVMSKLVDCLGWLLWVQRIVVVCAS